MVTFPSRCRPSTTISFVPLESEDSEEGGEGREGGERREGGEGREGGREEREEGGRERDREGEVKDMVRCTPEVLHQAGVLWEFV